MRADRQSIRSASKRQHNQRGFSLAEALVALAISAGVITAYYQAISTGLDLERRAKAKAQAALTADAVLDQIGFEIPLEATSFSRREPNGLQWQLTITPGADLINPNGGQTPSTDGLFTVAVQITGAELGDGYRLTTLRAGAGTIK